jgi:hypothetical protein
MASRVYPAAPSIAARRTCMTTSAVSTADHQDDRKHDAHHANMRPGAAADTRCLSRCFDSLQRQRWLGRGLTGW